MIKAECLNTGNYFLKNTTTTYILRCPGMSQQLKAIISKMPKNWTKMQKNGQKCKKKCKKNSLRRQK
jgi:Skp family chaperone for outer membrane proteins